MNVLYLQDHGGVGGAQSSLLDLLNGFAAIQAEVFPHVLVGEPGFLLDRLAAAGVSAECVRFPEFRKARDIFKRPRFLRQLSEIANTRRIDLIHANTHQTAPWAALLGRQVARPSCCTVREIIDQLRARKNRVLENHRVITISRSVQKELSAPASDRMRQVYNAIAAPDFIKNPDEVWLRLKLPKPPGRSVAFLGRLLERKGPQILIEAIPRVLQAFPETHFVFMGGGDAGFTGRLKQRVEELKIDAHVNFVGEVKEGARYLQAFDLFVLPSLNEPLGRVTVEAMYAGLPVIGTNTGGTAEIIEPDRTGRLVAPTDVPTLAGEIVSYLANDDLRRRHGEAGRRRASELFSPESCARQVSEIYRELASSRKERPHPPMTDPAASGQNSPGQQDWAWVRAGGTRWQVNRAFAEPAFLRRLAAPDLLLAPPAEPVRADTRPHATHLVRAAFPEFPSTPVIIKHFRYRNPWQSLKEAFRRSRAHRAFERALFLQQHSIPTATPIAAGRVGHALRCESFLLTEEVAGARRLRELRTSPGNNLQGRRLMRALARTMAMLHEAGLSHSDPSLSNFLVRNETSVSPELVVIDLDGLRAPRRLSARRVEKDLRLVFYRIQMTSRERLWFLAQYSRSRTGRPSVRQLCEQLDVKP